MTREKQEFYFFLKMLDWLFCNTSKECQFLTPQESDIYFEGVIKLRGLHVKLKKEYERMIKDEEKQHSTESIQPTTENIGDHE